VGIIDLTLQVYVNVHALLSPLSALWYAFIIAVCVNVYV